MCNFNQERSDLTCAKCRHFSAVEQWGYCNIRYHREIWAGGTLTVKQVMLSDEPACFRFQAIEQTTQQELPSAGIEISREPRPNTYCCITEVHRP